jgi:hypothetical protein
MMVICVYEEMIVTLPLLSECEPLCFSFCFMFFFE